MPYFPCMTNNGKCTALKAYEWFIAIWKYCSKFQKNLNSTIFLLYVLPTVLYFPAHYLLQLRIVLPKLCQNYCTVSCKCLLWTKGLPSSLAGFSTLLLIQLYGKSKDVCTPDTLPQHGDDSQWVVSSLELSLTWQCIVGHIGKTQQYFMQLLGNCNWFYTAKRLQQHF